MATQNKNIRRGIELYIDGKEVKNDIRAIETEARKLNKDIKSMTRGSEEYNRTAEKLRQYNTILRQHRNEIKGVEQQQRSWLSKGVQWFKDYSLQIGGAIAAITQVSMKLNAFRRQIAEKEDAAANLKALTGLDDENIAWLTKQAETLSTTMEKSGLRVRKSATEILEAYMLVGSAKPELLQDKQALNAVTIEAMRLAEAAKMELKEAVNAVTTSLNQYSAGADQAARFTNVLAAGSKFGAANVQDQAAAVVKAGVAASSAGVSFEQLVGVIEMLGEKGIKAEVAGTGLKRFFLKLQTGAQDTNPAVVGLDKALDNLAAKHLSMTQLQKMFGEEGINVAKILIDNTDKVRKYTEAVTGTNVAVEQAAINSDTTAAKMAQIRNQINLTGQELAKTLAPIFSQMVGWSRKFVMAMPAMIDFLKKYGLSTAALLTTLLLYNSYTAIATKLTKAWETVIAFAKMQVTAYTASMEAYREALTGSTTAQVNMTAAVKGTNIVTQAAVIVVGILKAAYYALSLQLTACVRTLKTTKAALAESGFGIVVLAVGAAVAALIRHNEKMKEARRLAEEQRAAEKALYKEYDEAAIRIRQLRKVAGDYTATLDDRKKAIDELQKLAPKYHASISKEGELIEDNKEKLDEYLKRLKASIVLESYKTKLSELLQKQREAEEEQEKASDQYWKIRQQNTLQGYDRNSFTAKLSRLFGMESEANAKAAKDKADKVLDEVNKGIDSTEQHMKEIADQWGFSLVDGNDGNDDGTGDGGGGSSGGNNKTETERQKRIREALEKIDAEYNKRAADLKQQYINGDIKTEQEYSSRLAQIELDRLKEKLKVAGLDEKQTSEFQQRIMDMKLSVRKRIDEMTKTSAKDTVEARLAALDSEYEASKNYLKDAYENGIIPTEQRYKEYLLALENNYNLKKKKLQEEDADERLRELEEEYTREQNAMRLKLAKGQITEDEYEKEVIRLRQKYAQKRLDVANQSNENLAHATKEAAEAEIEAERKQNEERKKLAEERRRIIEDSVTDITNLFGDLGETMGEWMAGEEADFKQFLKNLLVTLLDAVQKAILAQYSAILAKDILAKSWAGVASAAAKMAVINAAFGVAKGLINSFDVGGFTPNGRWDEPQGIVHSNEFVANRHAVRNPNVRPVLQLIDAAQRSGSIANLSGQQIAAVAMGRTAPNVTSQPSTVSVTQPTRDPELTAALQLLVRTTRQAASSYEKPVRAYTFADGRGGVNEAQALLDKMINNASRKI